MLLSNFLLNELLMKRLFIITLSFTVYMIPGLWGAPLKGISAWLPPQTTQDFDLYTNTLSSPQNNQDSPKKKYSGLFKAPHNLDAFFEYAKNKGLINDINNQNWDAVAKGYNGKAYNSKDSFSKNYDKKFKDAYNKYKNNPSLISDKDCL